VAQRLLPDEDLSPETVDAVITFQTSTGRYLRNHAVSVSRERTVRVSRNSSMRPLKRNKIQPGPKPERPDCPSKVRDFLNALELAGESFDQCDSVVHKHIQCGALAAYTINQQGLVHRLTDNELDGFQHMMGRIALQRDEVDIFLANGAQENAVTPVETAPREVDDGAPAFQSGQYKLLEAARLHFNERLSSAEGYAKKSEIVDWLKTNSPKYLDKDVSNRMADSMATIIRDDSLAAGGAQKQRK